MSQMQCRAAPERSSATTPGAVPVAAPASGPDKARVRLAACLRHMTDDALTHLEIAARLHIALGAVKGRIRLAMRRLRGDLANGLR